jgi:hypothetical protein
MGIQIGRPKRERDRWLDADALKSVGNVLTAGEQTVAKRLFLGKVAEADVDEAVQIITGLATGMSGEAKVIEVPAYLCRTKQKKEVTVTTPEAMQVIIENGGEFLAETSKEIKL